MASASSIRKGPPPLPPRRERTGVRPPPIPPPVITGSAELGSATQKRASPASRRLHWSSSAILVAVVAGASLRPASETAPRTEEPPSRHVEQVSLPAAQVNSNADRAESAFAIKLGLEDILAPGAIAADEDPLAFVSLEEFAFEAAVPQDPAWEPKASPSAASEASAATDDATTAACTEKPHSALSLPNVPAAPPLVCRDGCPAPTSRNLGTALEWAASPQEASRQAKETGKLLFLIHVSGNFETPGFT